TPPVITGEKMDPEWNGAVLDLEQKIIPATTVITPAFGVTDASIKPIDGVNSLQETWKVHGAPAVFPTIVLRSFNTDLMVQQTSELSIVPEGQAYTFGTLDLDLQDRKIDSEHVLRQVDKVAALPGSFNTYTTQMFTFPGIL